MPINSCQKGKLGERMFAKLVNKVMGYTVNEGVRRTPCSGAFASFKGDLIQTKGALSKYVWEVKNEAKPRLWAYVKQGEEEVSYDQTSVIAMKQPGSDKFYCIIEATALLSLIKKIDDGVNNIQENTDATSK